MHLALQEYLYAGKGQSTKPPTEAATVTISAQANHGPVAPGQIVRLRVILTVAPGWHVSAHRPTGRALAATTISLADGQIAELVDVAYPPGRELRFPSGGSMPAYYGTVSIPVKARLAEDLPDGDLRLALHVRTQPCDRSRCRQPRTDEAAVLLTVRRDEPKVSAPQTED